MLGAERRMCDRHSEEFNYYCLKHENLVCEKCVSEDHSETPCATLPVQEAIQTLQPELEAETEELKRLQKRTKEIIEGKHKQAAVDPISVAEQDLEKFYEAMKQKLETAKRKTRPFSETEITRQMKVKLNTLMTSAKRTATAASTLTDGDVDVVEFVTKLKNTKEQVAKAQELLHSLPNYVEMSLNEDFTTVIGFSGDPVNIRAYGKIENGFDDDGSFASDEEHLNLKEISTFYIEHCTDVVILKDHVIASVRDSVQKRDIKQLKYRQGLALLGAGTMCLIAESEIAVMQKHKCISILNILPKLEVMYRIGIEMNYMDMCFVVSLPSIPHCPDPSPIFAVCYTKRETFLTDYVDLVHAKETRFPGRRLPVYGSETSHIVSSSWGKHKSLFRGVTCVGTGINRTIIIGASRAVSCVTENGVLVWVVRTKNPVTYLMILRNLVCVAIHDDQRMMTIGKSGQIMEENILPANGSHPERFGVSNEIMLVKESGGWNWFRYDIKPKGDRYYSQLDIS